MEPDHLKVGDGFMKSICIICCQGLNPIIEDIQSISVCGHVFHEFCLQHMLESLPGANKKTCPMCKQKFSQNDVSRLYLQWVEDQPKASATRDSAGPRGELMTLEEKLAFVDQGLEQQQQRLRELKEELSMAKDMAGREAAIKMQAVTENSIFQQTLNEKMEELEQSSADRSKLQARILLLEKELATNKLASDLNIDEEDISRLTYFNHEGNTKDIVDTLRRSLIIRNRSYKELMAQHDLLAREKQDCQNRLAKVVQKKKNLKEKLKELKGAIREKDKEILRKKEKLKIKLKGLKRSLEEKDKEILRSSEICKRVRVEEAPQDGYKLGYVENSRSIVKKESADGTPESCCTGLLSSHASDAKVNVGFFEKQGDSNLKSFTTDVIYVDMDGLAYSQIDTERSANSVKGTRESHTKKPAELVADEQATPCVKKEKIDEREPIFEGLLGPCPQDNAGHSVHHLPSDVIGSVVSRLVRTGNYTDVQRSTVVEAGGREERNKSTASQEQSLLGKPLLVVKPSTRRRRKSMVSLAP